MISVFSRNSRLCDSSNEYAASFDGTGGAVRDPLPYKVNQDLYFSYWIRLNNTTSDGNLRFHFAQTDAVIVPGDFIRITYQALGTNRLEFNFRSASHTNQLTTLWNLHGANSAITGSSSITNYWNASNGAIKRNSNGYVHLLFHYSAAAFGAQHSDTSADCYWNGSLLTRTSMIGQGPIATTPNTSVNMRLATNTAGSAANSSNAFIDQLVILPASHYTTFKAVHNLSAATVAQFAKWMYNQGCPRSLVSDARYAVWNFEQTGDTTPPGAFNPPWSGLNPPFSYTTTHA